MDIAMLFKRDNERFSAIKFGQYIYGEPGKQPGGLELVTVDDQGAA
jgi:hypothetical protein